MPDFVIGDFEMRHNCHGHDKFEKCTNLCCFVILNKMTGEIKYIDSFDKVDNFFVENCGKKFFARVKI